MNDATHGSAATPATPEAGACSIFGAFRRSQERRRKARLFDAVNTLALSRGDTGGLLKRIDENRELFELLEKECPEVIDRLWWVEGWIRSNDAFFVQLREILALANPHPERAYPREWAANRRPAGRARAA
ncbi:hypothetical protein [Paraburkholderia sp. SIMBA_054]|uniref:hypothetical protein n=1 Tax=Paraburkholderia sp. SIMBA_054 TaxID=3085795 RepID=UPI00397C7CC9